MATKLEQPGSGPYGCIAPLIDMPVTRTSKGGHEYVTGFCPALGDIISVFHLKQNHATERVSSYVIRWPFTGDRLSGAGQNAQNHRTFSTIIEVEQFLRPACAAYDWIDRLDAPSKTLLCEALDHHLYGSAPEKSAPPLTDDCLRFLDLLSPKARQMSPARFDIPFECRTAIFHAIEDYIGRGKSIECENPQGCSEILQKISNAMAMRHIDPLENDSADGAMSDGKRQALPIASIFSKISAGLSSSISLSSR